MALITTSGGRRIDTHAEFKPAAKVKSDVCCNGDCSQAHECPRYQSVHDDPPTLSWGSLAGVIAGLAIVAYLFNVGVWQWN